MGERVVHGAQDLPVPAARAGRSVARVGIAASIAALLIVAVGVRVASDRSRVESSAGAEAAALSVVYGGLVAGTGPGLVWVAEHARPRPVDEPTGTGPGLVWAATHSASATHRSLAEIYRSEPGTPTGTGPGTVWVAEHGGS
jgi:hypothetical protein